MAFPSSPTNGQIHTQAGTTYVYDSAKTAWKVGSSQTLPIPISVDYTATAGQTTFVGPATPNSSTTEVYVNGVKLVYLTDFSISGNNIVLNSATSAGDNVNIVTNNGVAIGDGIKLSDADVRYVNVSGDTMTGSLSVPGVSSSQTVSLTGGAQVQLYTSTGSLRGYIQASENNGSGGAGLIIATSGGEGIAFKDSGVSGDLNVHINGGGLLSVYNQPAFHVSGCNVVASGNYLIYPSVQLNVGGYYNATNGRFTAPITGRYLFGFTSIGGNSDTVWRYYFRVNGANVSNGDMHLRLDTLASGSNYGTNGMYTFPWQMNAGDYAQVYFVSDSGTSMYPGSASGNNDYMRFWGYLLG